MRPFITKDKQSAVEASVAILCYSQSTFLESCMIKMDIWVILVLRQFR